MNQNRHHNIIIIILVVVALFIIIPFSVFIASVFSNKDTVSVSLVIAPQEVTLTEGNKKQTVSSDDVLQLSPGTHKLEFSKENFSTVTKEVTIDSHDPTRQSVFLEPQNDEATAELETEVNQMALQGISDLEHLDEEDFYEKNPIAAKLPINNYLTKIRYEIDPSDASGSSIIIIVDAYPGYRHAAITRIKSLGIDPTTLNIQFINYTNPFQL